jgi:hypothetical protein
MDDDGLHFLVHFFNDREHLFETITMARADQVEALCDRLSSRRTWYWGRYAPSERADYLRLRCYVESTLYDEYTREYGGLKERVPVYFYLYPGLSEQGALDLARQRTGHDEVEPQVLIARLEDLEDTRNITFTLNDSCTAYWQKATEAGMKYRVDGPCRAVLADHNRVFPFSLIRQLHKKYASAGVNYEVQVWDHQLLGKMSWAILGEAA